MKTSVRNLALRAGLVLCGAGAWLATPARAEVSPELVATYETRIGGEVRRWVFSRRGDECEYHFVDRDISERWRRDARGNASFARVFHRERTLVRYTHGDLLAIGVIVDWSRLSHVVAPPNDAGLVRGKSSRAFGYEAVHHRGRAGRTRVELAWIQALGIPAEIRLITPGRLRVLVKLVAVDTAASPAAKTADYRQIDFTDFGDMERDPFVRRHHDDARPSGAPSLALHEARRPPTAARAHEH